jgi:hypothetical protein
MKQLRKLYYSIFKRYERLELRVFNYAEADKVLKENDSKPEEEKWHLAKEEDDNHFYGYVYLERKKRIWE